MSSHTHTHTHTHARWAQAHSILAACCEPILAQLWQDSQGVQTSQHRSSDRDVPWASCTNTKTCKAVRGQIIWRRLSLSVWTSEQIGWNQRNCSVRRSKTIVAVNIRTTPPFLQMAPDSGVLITVPVTPTDNLFITKLAAVWLPWEIVEWSAQWPEGSSRSQIICWSNSLLASLAGSWDIFWRCSTTESWANMYITDLQDEDFEIAIKVRFHTSA